jgi:hypothetical protein
MKRIRFTKLELELISTMVSIAGAGPASEGDYQEWGDKEYLALESLGTKVYLLEKRISFGSCGRKSITEK